LKAVVDTNVLVSGIINVQHAPGRIVDRIRTRALQLVVDDRILAEYQSVLLGERLRKWIAEEDARDLLAFLFVDAERIVPTVFVQQLPDPGDAPFLETAITADVPLVTGNLKHFPKTCCRGQRVMTPAEFIRQLDDAQRLGPTTG
jgi:putative PIN family toxin of toxin-antitoxin system